MRLQAFAGAWQVERTITDLRAGRAGRFTGQARFVPVPEGLDYREEGTLTLDGAAPMAATRGYRWREGDAGAIEIWFEDGRFFHRFQADATTPAAVHDCPPDRYEVCYDFGAWPRWRAEWRVLGPRKDYTMVSRFSPAAG